MDYESEIIRISQNIRFLRMEKGLTVQEVAYRCDIERSNFCRIEAGKTNLTVRTMCKICQALDIKLVDLVG